MAHADYSCCAVCDDKLYYAGMDASTKEELCELCVLTLVKHGVEVTSVDGLLQWAKANPPEHVLSVLSSVGFRRCYYPNELDRFIASLPGAVFGGAYGRSLSVQAGGSEGCSG
jgi:hypothetical protein